MMLFHPPLLPALLAVSLLAPPVVAYPLAAAPEDAGSPRGELLREVNAARAAAGAPPLRLSSPLNETAQREADELARRGTASPGRGAQEVTDRRLREAGYDAREWVESISAITGSSAAPGAVLERWQEHDDGTWRRLMQSDFRDLGIGLARISGGALHVFLFAVPEGDAFARETAGLHDLARVRADLLARVNEVRGRAGLPPLTEDPHLDRAAQAHALDMLARSYFAHASPDGKTVRERAAAQGYLWRAIGENLAEGQLSTAEAIDGWMKSPHHRANLLDRDFTQIGTGLAIGRDRTGKYRVVWVQTFGRPRSSNE